MLFRFTDFGCFRREIDQRSDCQQTFPSPSMQFTWEESSWIGSSVSCVAQIHVLQFSTWSDLIGDVTPHMHFQRNREFF